jgi:hypothetical protein
VRYRPGHACDRNRENEQRHNLLGGVIHLGNYAAGRLP